MGTVDQLVVNSHDSSVDVLVSSANSTVDDDMMMSFVDNMIDLLWRNLLSLELGQSSRGKYPKLPCSTVLDGWIEASVPKTIAIFPVVLIQYRLVTDGQMDT